MKPHNCSSYLPVRPNSNNPQTHITYDEWETAWVDKQKISIIKLHRGVLDVGLKESKEWVESFSERDGWTTTGASYSWLDLCHKVGGYERDLCKEEVLELVSKAIDAKDDMLFDTMGDVLEALIMNIKKKGGTKAIASEIDEVINEL